MKKVTILAVVLLMTAILVVQPVQADEIADLGTLYYWYSDSNEIGSWFNSSIPMYCYNLSGNSSFPFSTMVNHAANQWSSALSVSITTTTDISSSMISVYGGTAEQFTQLGHPGSFNNVAGFTNVDYSFLGYWYYPTTNTYKSGCVMTSGVSHILDKNATLDNYKTVTTHEIGHALGWLGHSSSSSDIMYPYVSTTTTLTTRDITHLSQTY